MFPIASLLDQLLRNPKNDAEKNIPKRKHEMPEVQVSIDIEQEEKPKKALDRIRKAK